MKTGKFNRRAPLVLAALAFAVAGSGLAQAHGAQNASEGGDHSAAMILADANSAMQDVSTTRLRKLPDAGRKQGASGKSEKIPRTGLPKSNAR